MEIRMNYHNDGLMISLPPEVNVRVIEKANMPVLPDPRGAVKQALAVPVSGKNLRKAAKGKQSACVLICDITRPVPNGILLPEIIDILIGAGIPDEAVTVLVATGLHRPNEGAELAELVGNDRVLKTVRVENHFAKDDESHVLAGTTARDVPIRLDRRFVEADLKIVTGLVEPHFMAGYSGGRKVILPGIAHRETIGRIHTAEFLEDENAANCVLHQNPLHETQLAAAAVLGEVYAVNTVLDEKRNVSYVNFGPLIESHLAAVEFIRPFAEVPVTRKYATVITSGGGYPLDKTYYQTVKGMVGAMDLLAEGGNMVIVSACSEGLGSPEYRVAQKQLATLGPAGFLDSLRQKRIADIDEWQTEMQLKAMRKCDIHLFAGGLTEADHRLTGVFPVADLPRTLARLLSASGSAEVAVIPEGPYVIPVFHPR